MFDVGAGTLRLERELIDHHETLSESPSGMTFRKRRDANRTYLLWGEIDDGTKVSLARANRGPCWHQGSREWQEFRVLRCFLGDHVTEETEYETAEVVIDGPWSTWLPGVDVAADVEIAGAGTVTITVRDGRLVARGSAMTADQWTRRVTDPFCALLMLVSGHGVTVSETVLRRPDKPEVREVSVRRDTADTRRLDCLITPSELTPEVLVGWFDFVHQTVPVPVVLGQTICQRDRTVEADVLVLAACAEAIHREVFDELAMSKERFKNLSRAALEGLGDKGRRGVEKRLKTLTSMAFRERLKFMVERIDGLAEMVCGPVGARREDWLTRVADARNAFAHMKRSSPEDLDSYVDEMAVLYESLRWLLTAVILRHVGVPPERVTEAIESTSGFELFRERAVSRLPSVYGPANS